MNASLSSRPVIPLPGPLTVPELLDRAFRLYRKNAGAYTRLIAPLMIAYVPLAAISFGIELWNAFRAPATGASAGSSLLQTLASAALGLYLIYVTLAATHLSLALLKGEARDLRDHRREAGYYFGTAFGAGFLAGLVVGGIGAAAGILAALLGGGSTFSFYAIVLLVSAVGLFFQARWQVHQPGILEQGWGSREALGGSWRLTEGYTLRVMAYALLMWILGALFTSWPIIAVAAGLGALFGDSQLLLDVVILTAVLTLLTAIWVPIGSAITSVLYYDLRVRKEGIDIERRVEQAESAAQEPPIHASAD